MVGEFAAEAVAAMHGTGPGADQQRPAVIFVQQAGGTRRGALAERISAEAGLFDQFAGAREHLQQQWIMRIAAAHAPHEAARHAQPEARGTGRRYGRVGAQREPRVETEQMQQLERVGDGLRELPLPRVGACRAVRVAGQG